MASLAKTALLCAALALVAEAQEAPRAAVAGWDTGKASTDLWTPEAIEKAEGWKRVEAGATVESFVGDAAITNGRLLALARKQGTGLEIYSLGSGKPVYRSRLVLPAGA